MSGIHFRGTKETSERKTVGNRGLTTRGGGRPRSLLDRGISRLLSQISSQHGRKQLRGISSAAFTPLSRFPVKRLNGAPFVFAATERRSFLASSFRGSFHSRWGEASRIAEKKKKRRRGKKEERGKKKKKGRGEREKKIGREGVVMLWRIIVERGTKIRGLVGQICWIILSSNISSTGTTSN